MGAIVGFGVMGGIVLSIPPVCRLWESARWGWIPRVALGLFVLWALSKGFTSGVVDY